MTIADLKIFTKIPEIHTERLILREITPKDLYDVNEYATDPEVSRYLLWSPHKDLTHTKLYLNNIRAKYKRAEFYDWGVIYDGKMIGTCGFTAFDIPSNSAEIGYVLNRQFWCKGIGYEAACAVLRFGFDILGLERIEVRYMTDNLASEALAIKCGMKKEGTLRHAILAKGAYRDIGICSILRKEYYEEI